MPTIAEINYHIEQINEIFEDFIEYNDSISFVDSNQKSYVTSDELISDVEKANYSAIQALEKIKKDSLQEYSYTTVQDTILLNLCFKFYNTVTDELIDSLINANDFLCYNRNDMDPNSPIIPKKTEVIYYK